MTTPTTTDTIIRAQSRFIERRNHNEKTRAHIRLHDELRRSVEVVDDGLKSRRSFTFGYASVPTSEEYGEILEATDGSRFGPNADLKRRIEEDGLVIVVRKGSTEPPEAA